MGCHTWGLFPLDSISSEHYNKLKLYCDEIADRYINMSQSEIDSFNELSIKFYGRTIEELNRYNNKIKQNAILYKEKILTDKSAISYYIPIKYINGIYYVDESTCYDYYFRLDNYSNKKFTSSNELIKYLKKQGWCHIYWYDENGKKIKGNTDIKKAKTIIKRLFTENPYIMINFG